MNKTRTSRASAATEERKEYNQHCDAGSKVFITSGDELRQIFSKVQCNLNVVHVNCQSIAAHYMQMLSTFSLITVDAILVSETFLKPDTDSTEVNLPGFTLIRNDRSEKGGGGVAIYLRENINFVIVDRSPNEYSKSAEHLFIETFNNGEKVLIGVFYCPSLRINYFKEFNALLQRLRPKYDNFICLGDFNTDLIKNNGRSRKLMSIIDDHNLHILPLSPTHIAPHSAPSVLDLIIVSSPHNVGKAGQLAACFSYHDLLYLSYTIDFKTRIDTICSASMESDYQSFLQSSRVRESLALQLTAMKKYKNNRTDNDFEEYQKCRELVKKLEIEFKSQRKKCKLL